MSGPPTPGPSDPAARRHRRRSKLFGRVGQPDIADALEAQQRPGPEQDRQSERQARCVLRGKYVITSVNGSVTSFTNHTMTVPKVVLPGEIDDAAQHDASVNRNH